PEASGPASSTEGSPRPCDAPSRSESRGPAGPSDRVQSCFGRPSSHARRLRSRRSRPPSPRRRHSTVGLARQARNEALQIGYGGAIHLSLPRYRRCSRRQESPNPKPDSPVSGRRLTAQANAMYPQAYLAQLFKNQTKLVAITKAIAASKAP